MTEFVQTPTDVRTDLIIALRALAAYELGDPISGVITARVEEDANAYVCNPVGVPWEIVEEHDLVEFTIQALESDTLLPINREAVRNNLGLLRRDGIGAVTHVHASSAILLATTGRHLEPFRQEACVFFEDHHIIPDRFELGFDRTSWLAEQIGDAKALAIANHGLITQGRSIPDATAWALFFEDMAEQFLRLLSLRLPYSLIPDDAARSFRASNGTAEAGWLHFQSLADLADLSTAP